MHFSSSGSDRCVFKINLKILIFLWYSHTTVRDIVKDRHSVCDLQLAFFSRPTGPRFNASTIFSVPVMYSTLRLYSRNNNAHLLSQALRKRH